MTVNTARTLREAHPEIVFLNAATKEFITKRTWEHGSVGSIRNTSEAYARMLAPTYRVDVYVQFPDETMNLTVTVEDGNRWPDSWRTFDRSAERSPEET